MHRARRGFTLIELLVAVVIIAVLVSMAVGYFRKSKPHNTVVERGPSNSSGQFYSLEQKKREEANILLKRAEAGEFRTAGEVRAAWSDYLSHWSTNPEERTLAMSIPDDKLREEFIAMLKRAGAAAK